MNVILNSLRIILVGCRY